MFIEVLQPALGLIFFQTIIILFTAFLLKRYAWVHILAFINKEEQAYLKAKKDEKVARKKTEVLHRASEQIIKEAEERSKRIIDSALATKEAFIEEAKLVIEKERASMLLTAQAQISQRETASFDRLKKDAASLVVQVTEKLLLMELSEKNQQELFLGKLIETVATGMEKVKS